MDSNEMKKKPRGTYYHASNGREIIVKLKDNQAASIASTAHGYAACTIIYHRALLQTGAKTNPNLSSKSFSRIQ